MTASTAYFDADPARWYSQPARVLDSNDDLPADDPQGS
jgi:hypothetical protein